MKTISISINFNERLNEALLDWRSGASREKAKSIILGLLQLQRECGKMGQKNAFGQAVVSVSSRMISAFYGDYASQKKFRHWVIQHKLVLKDRSWLNQSLAKALNKEIRCDSWHITETKDGKRIEVQYEENFGLYGIYKRNIEQAQGKAVDAAHHFEGTWAIKDYNSGKLPWSDFIEVGKAAHNILKGKVKSDSPSCRVFDAVSLCKKSLRGRCFVDAQGKESKEVFDIPGAITTTAPLGFSALLGKPSTYRDENLHTWAHNLSVGSASDPYKQIWKKIYEIDPNTNAYGTKKWTKAVRKTLKMDIQCVANCDLEYLMKCKKEYHKFFDNLDIPDNGVYQNKRRQWLVWNAIRKANKPLAEAIMWCKASGVKDAFYRLHTMGEKILMNAIIADLKKMGITVHRVHDAIWTSDERLTSLNETQMQKLVGMIILKRLSKFKDGYKRQGLVKMGMDSGITKEEIRWVMEGLENPAKVQHRGVKKAS